MTITNQIHFSDFCFTIPAVINFFIFIPLFLCISVLFKLSYTWLKIATIPKLNNFFFFTILKMDFNFSSIILTL